MGLLLAHYLEEEFGCNSVVKIGAWNILVLNQYMQNSNLTNLTVLKYLTKATNTGLPDSLLLKCNEYIYSINLENHLPLIEVSKICSRYIFNNIIYQIAEIGKYLPDSLAELYIKHHYLRDIFDLTGLRFKNDSALKHWSGKDNFDFPDFLYSGTLGDTLFAYISRIPPQEFSNVMRSYYLSLFGNYGISYIPFDTSNISEEYLKKWKTDRISRNYE